MFLIMSWQYLTQSSNLKFIQNDYEEILCWADKQLDCYYFIFAQPFKTIRKKMIEEISSLQSSHFNDDNIAANITQLVIVSSSNVKEVKKAFKLGHHGHDNF